MAINDSEQDIASNSWLDLIKQLVSIGSDFSWLKTIGQLWTAIYKWIGKRSCVGMYEALEYESTLELKDHNGRKAVIKKCEKVRYLQDNIIAYQDQAWGGGTILDNYRCTPGVPVDSYRLGYKTYILISLRAVKNKGDIDNFNIEWNIKEGFLLKTGFWATEISHRTRRVTVKVIFPKRRPPRNVSIIEKNSQKAHLLEEAATVQLPDGRWLVTWGRSQPKLYEQYILKWEW
jgi:hypothetical protein